jgi:hypothetical protein
VCIVPFALHFLTFLDLGKHILILWYITAYFMLSDIDCPLPSEDDLLQQLSNELEVWSFSLYLSMLFTLKTNFYKTS